MTEFARPSRPAPGHRGASEIAIVGAGRVGCAIGRALAAKGHRIVAASTLNPASASRVREALGDVPLTAPADAVLAADLVVIAVPDDALEDVVAQIASSLKPGAAVVHTCGLQGASVLAGAGVRVAAIHPAQAIPSPSTDLAGVWFAITAPPGMREWSEWFVEQIGGIPVHIPEEQRAVYHAALVMASNFAVTLAGDAQDLLPDPRILAPLLRQTVENVVAFGADEALTGPVVRGDARTIEAHLAALPPQLLETYVANARRTLDRAIASGRLDPAKAAAVSAALDDAESRTR